jgi:predicted amidohydrolase YtcJ
VLNKTRDELLRAFALSEAHDVQLAIHANGTRAQSEVLHALIDFGRKLDVRIEHLGNVLEDERHLDLWKQAGVKAAMQPAFLTSFIGDYVPMLFPGSGVSGRMPLRTILDSSIYPSISSDFGLGADVGSTNPWRTMWACVARQSFWGLTVEPHESIGVHEALRAHTVDAAAAIGRSDDLGTLEPGKIADIAVLDQDPLAVDLDHLRETRAHQTYRAGRLVHAEGR